jgi:hypothetical protein
MRPHEVSPRVRFTQAPPWSKCPAPPSGRARNTRPKTTRIAHSAPSEFSSAVSGAITPAHEPTQRRTSVGVANDTNCGMTLCPRLDTASSKNVDADISLKHELVVEQADRRDPRARFVLAAS